MTNLMNQLQSKGVREGEERKKILFPLPKTNKQTSVPTDVTPREVIPCEASCREEIVVESVVLFSVTSPTAFDRFDVIADSPRMRRKKGVKGSKNALLNLLFHKNGSNLDSDVKGERFPAICRTFRLSAPRPQKASFSHPRPTVHTYATRKASHTTEYRNCNCKYHIVLSRYIHTHEWDCFSREIFPPSNDP